LYRLYGWSKEERDQVFDKYGRDILWNSLPYPEALEVLEYLYNKYEISFITARPLFFRDVTIEWLNSHKINYHHISFTENKLGECQKLNVDVLIDDAPHYAEEFVLSNKPVILYEQPYNLHINHKLVYRARDWNDVKKNIESLCTT